MSGSHVPDPGDVLARIQAAGRLPSVAAGLVRGGAPVWSDAISVLPDGPDGAPVTAASAFRIGSITKTLTAVLVMQARDDGLLALDDRLDAHLPGTGYPDATIAELLAHTSGMQSEPVGPWWERTPGAGIDVLLAANDGSGRVDAAGRRHHYSNLGYALLGELVARLRDSSWWDLVRTRLLEPLAMTSTSWDPPADHAPGLSVDHFAHTLAPEPTTDTGAMAPAGQLWSTVDDLLRWGAFLIHGHPAVLAEGTLALMARPHAPATGYGLGLRVLRTGGRVLVGHTGSMPGFQAALFVDRERADVVAVLASATTGLPSDRVAGMFLGLEEPSTVTEDVVPAVPWVPTETVPDAVRELLGVWFWGNTAYGAEWAHGRLLLRDLRTLRAPDRFVLADDTSGDLVGVAGYHHGERLVVARDATGRPHHLVCATFVFTRTPYDPTAPVPGGVPA